MADKYPKVYAEKLLYTQQLINTTNQAGSIV